MSISKRAAPAATLVAALSGSSMPTRVAGAQPPPAVAPVTLRTWSDDVWLRILDRDGTVGGRLGAVGVLRRFQPTIGRDYQTDLLSTRGPLLEDAEWHARARGVRVQTGSVDRYDLLYLITVRHHAAARRWFGEVRLDVEQSPEARRALPQGRVGRAVGRGVAVHVGTTLPRHKPDLDMSAGVTVRRPRADADVELTLLDGWNNFLYRDRIADFDALGGRLPVGDTLVRSAGRRQVASRARLALRPGRAVRAELQAGGSTPGVVTFAVGSPLGTAGFVQRDRGGFACGVVQWSPSVALAVGGTASAVSWRTARESGRLLVPSAPAITVDERTAQAGLFVLAQPSAGWGLDAWAGGMWRTEDRRAVAPSDGGTFEDRAWMARLTATRAFASGLRLGGTVVLDDRGVRQAAPAVPSRGSLAVRRLRVVAEPGWRWPGDRGMVTGGVRLDYALDGAEPRWSQVAGFQARVLAFW